MTDKNRVLQVKAELNTLKTKQSRLEGQFDVVKKTMVDKYGISDIKEFIKKRDAVRVELDTVQQEMETLLLDVEKQLSFV